MWVCLKMEYIGKIMINQWIYRHQVLGKAMYVSGIQLET